MFEETDYPPVVQYTDGNVYLEIHNPLYGDLTETFTLYDYYTWVLG